MAKQNKGRKLFATAASAALVATALTPAAFAAETTSFKDADKIAEYAKESVEYLVGKGAISGYNGSFNPKGELTRAEAATILAKALDLKVDESKKTTFEDAKDHWASEEIAALQAHNKDIITGFTDGTFRPDAKITRAQLALIITTAYGLKQDESAVLNFTDNNAEWSKGSINTLASLGIVAGTTTTTFSPNEVVTREQAAAFFHRTEVPAKRLAVETTEVKVTSVSAINAKQIEVKFNKVVTKATAEDETNYTIRKSGDASFVALAGVTATLAEDGKSVVLTADGTNDIETALSVQAGAVFEFKVKNLKDAAGTVAAEYTQTLKVKDEVAPTFVSAAASAKTSTNQVTLTFSEPVVVASGVVKVNGSFGSVAQGSTPNTLTVTAGNLEAGKSYEVEILNFVDYAGNFLTPNPVKTSVTVSSNISAPVVTDVKVVRDNLIEVTFDKAMAPGTLTNNTVKLLDGNFTNIATTNITGITAKANSGNKVFQIALDDTPALPFNNGVFNGTLVFSDAITDSVGNKVSTTNRTFSVTRDVVDPAVVSVKHVKANTAAGATYGGVALTTGAVVVKFNEEIAKGTLTGLKLIDNKGVDVTSAYIDAAQITAAQVSTQDATELVIPLKTAVTTASGITSFTLRLVAGSTTDLSLDTNDSTAAVNTFTTVPGTESTGDKTAPVIASVTPGAGNVLSVAVTEANNLDSTTVLNLNNYRLDGAPLPAGTYVTVTGTAPNYVINLNLPAGSISDSRNYAVNVSGIKDEAGNTSVTKAFNTVALVDDVKPELKTAILNGDGSVTLSYSETLSAAILAADLVVKVNGSTVATSALGVTNVAAGADAGKDVLVVKTSVDQGLNAAYGGGDDTLFIEADAIAGLSAGDIVIATGGSYTVANHGAAYNLNSASTITVGTIATPTSKDKSTNNNTLKGNTTITVK